MEQSSALRIPQLGEIAVALTAPQLSHSTGCSNLQRTPVGRKNALRAGAATGTTQCCGVGAIINQSGFYLMAFLPMSVRLLSDRRVR